MATLWTRWLLSILLVNLPTCSASGPPAAPSPPDCNIPCDDKHNIDNCADIHCSWDPSLDPQIPTNYSLHWEPAKNEEGHVINGTSFSGIILRDYFSRGDLHVWVQAKNQHGSAESEKVSFNTEDIKKPPTPNVSSSHPESLDIEWTFFCDQLSFEHCEVRHRAEADQVWVEHKTGVLDYTFDNHQPGTVYEFQVRCSCDKGLSSDWSAINRVRTPEMAPVGELDLWRNCGKSHATSDCFLTWKRLPISQARGLILGCEVRLTYNNGTAVLVNVSTAGSEGWLVCDEMLCRFNLSLKDVSSASVSAYNAHGATVPSYLTMPIPGKEKNEQAIRLKMNEDNLTVSWDLPSQLLDNLKEYVVQYKQAWCPPGRQFDWIKVNKSQTTGIFKGQYENYTPYQVSLFTVSHSNEVHHLSSVIGYSHEGTPSTGPSFTVSSIADTHVTLFWQPVPLCMQNGVILSYQVIVDGGENGQKVYNVSASPHQENKTFELQDLSPGQEYEVRIRAVTAAGPGENTTRKVKTKHPEDFATLKLLVLGIFFLVIMCCIVALYKACQGDCPMLPTFLYEKVPDARNSHIFRHMKHQINDPLARICIPVYEPHPKISVLEVVEIQPRANGLTQPMVGDQCSQTDCQDDQGEETVMEECHRTDRRYGREEYSKMIDSDEERYREEEHREDSWSSAEDEQSTSGYEKHFMPTALEVLDV